MGSETELTLEDGRTLQVYDTGGDGDSLPVFWHHGTPNTGEPPLPLSADSARLGIRWVGYDRPGYGGSPARPGRDVASAAAEVAGIADALGIERFAVLGHSGGGPHALACAALLPERVSAAVGISGLAPFDAPGLDWYAGMAAGAEAELRAAAAGRAALEEQLRGSEFDPEIFTPADHAALEGPWGWFHGIVGRALSNGLDGMVDDDLAYVTPWGFDPAGITVPVLLLHGDRDRIVPAAHGRWLAERIGPATAELRLTPGDGHVSVLDSAPQALQWLREQQPAA